MLSISVLRQVHWRAAFDRAQVALTWIAGAAVYPLIGPRFFSYGIANSWAVADVYSYFFDVFSILTGLLFAFYTIVVASENEFMKYLRENNVGAYRQFRREMRLSIALGATLTLGSLPYVVIAPTPTEPFTWTTAIGALWFATVLSGLIAFWRVATTFVELVDDPPIRLPPG